MSGRGTACGRPFATSGRGRGTLTLMRPDPPPRHPRARPRRGRGPGRPRPAHRAGAARHHRRARLAAAARRPRPTSTPTRRRPPLDLLDSHGHAHRRARPDAAAQPTTTCHPHTTAALAGRSDVGGVADAQASRRRWHRRPAPSDPDGADRPPRALRGARPDRGAARARRHRGTPRLRRARRGRRARPRARSTAGPAPALRTCWCGSPRVAPSIGPFVVPGETACLRCVDAHCTDADPSWPLLVRQYAAASSRRPPRRCARSRWTRCSRRWRWPGRPETSRRTSTGCGPPRGRRRSPSTRR